MLKAMNNVDVEVYAWATTFQNGPFHCPECNQEVKLRQGVVNVHHFAHTTGSTCEYYSGTVGESKLHSETKREIYQTLARDSEVSLLKLERKIGNLRADVSFVCHASKVAVEVQVSFVDYREIARRSREYASMGISVLWVIPKQVQVDSRGFYKINAVEKYLHALYFGQVYYWLEGDIVKAVHFEPATTWVDGWAEHSGYECNLKTFRAPRTRGVYHISELASKYHAAWNTSTFSTPQCLLWCA